MKLYEEFKEYETMWGSLTEWLDSNKKKITLTGNTGGWPLHQLDDQDSCEGCGCVVENIVNTSNFFSEPYILQNGHKLCSDCLEEWIKLPKGFIDKFILIGLYDDAAGDDIDDFIEHLKFQQQDIDLMIQEWNKRKKQNLLNLNPNEIDQAENNFINACTVLHLSAQASDFI